MTLIVMFLIRFLPQETNSGSSPQILWNAQECARLRHILGTFAIRLEEWCRPTARKSWWAGTGLNRRHQDFQSCALPTELPAHQTREDNRRARTRLLRGVLRVHEVDDEGPFSSPEWAIRNEPASTVTCSSVTCQCGGTLEAPLERSRVPPTWLSKSSRRPKRTIRRARRHRGRRTSRRRG